ncbi:MAG: acyl-CoA thioesterase, partial [Desulfobacterales bacterium]|nr:acyl-CoA thioesterase [Desulfobacterales bacterium]
SEDPYSGKVKHTASAYLTMVALDKNGRPKEVPGLILETDEEKRRNNEAKSRRKVRLEEKRKEMECR